MAMLKMGRREYESLRQHAADTYPHECCGVLLGMMEEGSRTVAATARCTNTEAASDWFQIDPRQIVRIQREAAEIGQDIVGFYHSHPDDEARWSKSDLVEAHWIGCSYVIVSVRGGKPEAVNSFFLAGGSEEDKRFEDEPIKLRS
jgi:proteasome lid subunit RPN8/RPN11